ncbi:M20/M25/M40 family metallo-hydrolase [Solirubrobacter sp. CPCC 204708]|uniref:M20/M25/M40 family metallo-hydrolase n=1 Tax=Solirubrobacter deserti TaxID=2282478 RepID=A0ABT4RSR9_9ACTN|nr:M20/M25/M40 family metallo-hydrolase [Solirubrobacter deserti]MBE2315929.1 M20/M25/M40 family metallo-hydrolase [Solirubrobacter deserti]MDA0141609.1 M20/M25/M40 family metallo-hydrolase [Solirubrobacter deserti]
MAHVGLDLKQDLAELIAIPSISPAPLGPLHDAFERVKALFAGAGVQDLRALELPDTAPVLVGEIPPPPGAPTVLLYSHYDVVPAGDEALWTSPPFEPVERDGAIYGRGSADSKANIVAHAGALQAWDGRPPVGIKLVIEGQEEVGGGALTTYPPTAPELFAADAMLIGDMGSVRPGVPTLTVALRGMAMVTVEVRTLDGAKHSGQFGGAAPDALLAVLRALASLHDEHGDVAVEGLRRDEWNGESYSDDEFRALAEVRDGMPLIGTGGLGSRVWSGPAITVTGIDVPSVENALNAVSPYARATINLRVHPEQDAVQAQAALVHHLRAVRPFGIELEVSAGATGNGFAAGTGGPAYAAARAAMVKAWGIEPVSAAGGGSIPLVNALAAAAPHAEILLVGATDGYANIHAPDERVLIDELERAVGFEAAFFGELAERARG